MRTLVAAFDKYRGSATAREVAAAVGRAAAAGGWTAIELPLADGGEGTLEAVGGEVHHAEVAGPLGQQVQAEWRLLDGGETSRRMASRLGPCDGATAVVEAAQAVGRALLQAPREAEPVRASTTGVGQLILAAADAGARRIVVGAGGSATTDGGWGAVQAIGRADRLGGAQLVVACDTATSFGAAARVFGPQKGATPAQVAELDARLASLAGRYRRRFGVDVAGLAGSGAAGGLAGGLAALGAVLLPGFDLVAAVTGLHEALAGADVVTTGEGRLDATSFTGKVVGGVVRAAGPLPVWCVPGDADAQWAAAVPARLLERWSLVTLVDAVGPERAWHDTAAAVADVVACQLGPRDARLGGPSRPRLGPGGGKGGC